MCVCVCVCVCRGEGRRGKGQTRLRKITEQSKGVSILIIFTLPLGLDRIHLWPGLVMYCLV